MVLNRPKRALPRTEVLDGPPHGDTGYEELMGLGGMRSVFAGLILGTLLLTTAEGARPSGHLGVAPVDAWTCPASHPIKGNFTTYSGEPCIYHVPGGQFYRKTKPERCYATEEEAVKDGCRRSKR